MDLEKFKTLTREDAFKVAGIEAGVSPSILQNMWAVESGQGTNMLSPAGAEGHFQLMPKTRATWEQRLGSAIDPNDFHDSLFVAAQQVKENMRATKGDLGDALRMYNSGTDRAKWDNPETNAYVPKIMGAPNPVGDLDILTTAAADVRAGAPTKQPKEYYSKVAQAISEQVGFQEAASQIVGDQLTTDTISDVAAARKAGLTMADKIVDAVVAAPKETPFDTSRLQDSLVGTVVQEQRAQSKKDAVTLAEMAASSFDTSTASAALYRMWKRDSIQPNQAYMDSYIANIGTIEKGYQGDELVRIREAVSAEDEARIKADIQREKDSQATTFSHGTAAGLLMSMASGVADPPGWLAGFGVGKVAQLANISAKALFARKAYVAGVGSMAAEGAVGNVLVAATMDAAGEHTTLNDYALALGAGGVMGVLASPLVARGARREALKAEFDRMEKNALLQEQNLWSKAQEKAGPGASADDIARAADNIQTEEAREILRIALAEVPDQERMLPRGLTDDAAAPQLEHTPGSEVAPFNPTAVVDPLYVGTEADDIRFGLDTTIADPAERAIIRAQYLQAERFLKDNPINEAALTSLGLDKVGWESTGLRLLNSKNPVARMAGQVLLESTTGAGGRRRSASLQAYLRERIYTGDVLNQYESVYGLWRNRNGGSGFMDMMNGAKREEFDRAVALYREAVHRNEVYGGDIDVLISTAPNEVKMASKVLDDGYNRMRIEMQTVGVVGSARLGKSSKGYMTHQISAARVKNMTDKELGAVTKMLSRQFQQLSQFDKDFSDKLAVSYLERARDRAYGQHPVPVNIYNAHAGDIVKDALEAMKIPQEEIHRIMGKYSRGGAGFTKERLELDLWETFDDGVGGTGRLIDLFNFDHMGMYRSYARRAAGEVALAQYGVMGKSGLDMIKKAMTSGKAAARASDADVQAFEQVAAELLNSSYGKYIGKWMDNALILSRLSRLNGMGFTQLGELANAIPTIGIMGAARVIKDIPRLLREVGQIKAGNKAANPILNSVELVGGPIGTDAYKMIGLYDVADNSIQVYGKEQVTLIDRVIRAGGNVQAMLSGQRALTAVQTRGVAEQIIHKAMRFIRDGKDSKALADIGLTPRVVEAIRKDLSKITKWDGDHLIEFDITKMTDPQLAAEAVQAIHRGAAQIIQRTFTGETGKYVHSGFLRMITQFRTFGIAAMEKQAVRQYATVGAVKAFGYLVGAMSFAVPIQLARLTINSAGMSRKDREVYLERNASPFALGRAVLNYASLAGLSSDILDLAVSGVDTITGGGLEGTAIQPRGGRSRGAVAGQIPLVGWLDDAFSGNPHKTLKALPFGNLPYLMPLINQFK